MGSFADCTFSERGQGAKAFPTWSKPGTAVVLHVPGGDVNVIQRIGVGLPKLALQVRCTEAEMAALREKVKTTGTLVFSFETTTARLSSISGEEVMANKDTYFATLNLTRTDGDIGAPSGAFALESGDLLALESGDILATE